MNFLVCIEVHIVNSVLQVKQEETIKAQIFSVIKGKPYEEHVVRRIHFVENDPKHQRKHDKRVRIYSFFVQIE